MSGPVEQLPAPFVLLVQGYFHQDWDLNGPTAKAVLQLFASREPPGDVVTARDTAARLAASGFNEDQLEGLLKALGIGYGPAVDGLTYQEWLGLVIETLAEPADPRRSN